MNYLIGIDIGTTNTKAVAYTVNGDVLGSSNRSYPVIFPQEGFHELDPKVLLEAALEVMGDVITENRQHELKAICFSAAMHGLIAVDKNGEPLTNMITWADLRSSEYAAKLRLSPVAKKLYERTGTPIHAMTPLCKLMWMKDNLPEVFTTAHKFISIKEFIFFHLFNEYIVDRSLASSTGLFDIYSLDWNSDALELAGIDASRLSRHVDASYILRGMKTEYAARFNIDDAVPVVIGASDGCLAHIGSNAFGEKDISLTIGTSGAVRIMTDEPVYDPKQRIFNYLLSGHQTISGGPVNNGGNVLQWFAKAFLKKDVFAPEDFETFIEEALEVAPGSEGLVFLPYIYGERAPVWDAEARGVFYGVSAAHTVAHFMRAAMEGVSFALLDILESVEEFTGPVSNIYASGGFIRSQKWLQLLADVMGRKISVTLAQDSSAAGAVILGMKALGIIARYEDAAGFFSIKDTFEPATANREVYRENYKVYSRLYEKLKDIKN
jgi:gluconokinase